MLYQLNKVDKRFYLSNPKKKKMTEFISKAKINFNANQIGSTNESASFFYKYNKCLYFL
jgi:hypothetical protein